MSLRRLSLSIAVALVALGLGACSPSGMALTQKRTQGYELPKDAVKQVRVGQHADTIKLVLGSPQTTNSFGDETAYYYIETKVDQTAFGLDMIKERTVLAVYFDKNQRVVDTAVYGAQDGKVVHIQSRRTASFGEDRNFVESIIASF